MPSAMHPLYGLSITEHPPVAATEGEMEMALDDTPLLRSAMERSIIQEVTSEPGLNDQSPSPDQTLENNNILSPPRPSPGSARR